MSFRSGFRFKQYFLNRLFAQNPTVVLVQLNFLFVILFKELIFV